MDTHLAVAVLCLLLLGCASGRPERLSADQKAPASAAASAGRSLAPPRPGAGNQVNDDDDDKVPSSSALQQLLTRLRLRTSGQTPADTSLLQTRRKEQGGGALERLHIKTSGQTPADTSLLPRRDPQKNAAKETSPKEARQPSSQSRRAGQGPAHVTLINAGQASPAADASRQTPANVGLLKPGGGPAPPAAPAAGPQEEEGVRREESSSFKEVNGESVRVVVGNYGYDSPEGLPVSFKYMSDENGNQASFTIGAGGGSGSGSRPGGSGKGTGAAGGGGASKGAGGAGKGAGGGASKGGAATGAGGDGDRKYLPPK